MSKIVNIQIKFDRITQVINLMKELEKKDCVNWSHFSSESILYSRQWESDEIIALIESVESKIDFEELAQNEKIQWDAELISRFKNKPIWNEETFYKNLKKVDVMLIDEYVDRWNWRFLGQFISRRDASLNLLIRYRDYWNYIPSEIEDVDVDHGQVVSVAYFLGDDSIFNNPHIPWHLITYKLAFKEEIIRYKQFIQEYAQKHREKQEWVNAYFECFRRDVLRDVPF